MNRKVKIYPLVISTTLVSCIASALLAWVYLITVGPITALQQKKTNAALRQMLPAFDNQPSQETVTLDDVTFYTARQNGKIIGFAGEAVTHKGYAGDVTVMAGLKPDGMITTVIVTKQSETPGLGTVVTERVREKTLSGLLSGKKETGLPPNKILDQFNGMKAETKQTPWAVRKDGGNLDAVTGATITSRAVGGAVFAIAEKFSGNREQLLKEIK